MTETTALGAAMAAGSAAGIDVWDLTCMQPVPSDTFLPSLSEDERLYIYSYFLIISIQIFFIPLRFGFLVVKQK